MNEITQKVQVKITGWIPVVWVANINLGRKFVSIEERNSPGGIPVLSLRCDSRTAPLPSGLSSDPATRSIARCDESHPACNRNVNTTKIRNHSLPRGRRPAGPMRDKYSR